MAESIHVHGYDQTAEATPGTPGAVTFTAVVKGVYEIETHESATAGGSPVIPLHGLGGRQDLPVPFTVVLVAAAATLIVSFLVLTWRWPTARYTGVTGIRLPRIAAVADAPTLRWAVRAVGLVLAGWALLALLAGPDELVNPIFGFVYVWVWVALVPVSLLLGPVWRMLNPFRSVHLLLARINPGYGTILARGGGCRPRPGCGRPWCCWSASCGRSWSRRTAPRSR